MMQTFKALVVVRQPLPELWQTVRDRLPELVPMIEDIDRIAVLEREDVGDGRVRLVNEWWASQRIPELVARAIDVSQIGWIDRCVWDGNDHVGRWVIEPLVLADAITCHGTTSYESAMGGRGVRVTVEGSFDVDLSTFAGLSRSLQRPIASFVESIATTMIPRSTRTVVRAAAATLTEEHAAGA